jgi:PhnB protein
MSIKSLNPYIILNGDAARAIALYQEALGAELPEPIMRYRDIPGQDAPEGYGDRVMHARLLVNGHPLMISDARPGHPVPTSSNVEIMLDFDDLEHARRVFAMLAEGGTVTTALVETFWGATFGSVDDRFGVSWMFNCAHAKSGG